MMNKKQGSALPAVLGLLLLAAAVVFAFVFYARTERNVMRQAHERTSADILNESILSSVMSHELPMFIMQVARGETMRLGKNGGNPSNFRSWQSVFPDASAYFQPQVFSSFDARHSCGTAVDFLRNDTTNYLPAALAPQIRNCHADWIPIETVDEDTGKVTATNAVYAYAVVDVSGFLDASSLSTNQLDWLERISGDIKTGCVDLFLEDMTRQSVPSDAGVENYISRKDLILRNRAISPLSANIMHYSYSPAPDVTITNGNIYSDLDDINRGARLVPKFNINSLFGDNPTESDIRDYDTEKEIREKPLRFTNWFREVTNRLDYIGFAASDEIAWSLLNFMDPDRIPQSPRPTPWQDPWPVEDVPLINEIAVAQVPLEFGYTNTYAAAIEVWYPFVTNTITEADDAWLVTAVYTNWPPDAHMLHSSNWTNDIIFLSENSCYGVSFSNKIERMEFGTSTEFLTFASPAPYISFPVNIYMPVDEEKVNTFADGTKYVVGRENLKIRETQLPLGVVTYTTYSNTDRNQDIWTRGSVTVTNEIRIITRVMLGGQWVDEGMAYNPDDPVHDTPPYAFRETCGFEVNDPRRNDDRNEWKWYKSTTVTGVSGLTNVVSEAVSNPDAPPTFGNTNSVCNAWHLYGQGLPIVHFNGPLERTGDIGYIYEPYSYKHDTSDSEYLFERDDDGRVLMTTNHWQSICLADSRPLAYYDSYTFSAGSLLEFFTVRCATNHSVRGLVNAFTPWPGVMGALFADAEVGHGIKQAHLDDAGIAWATNFYGEIINKYENTVAIPIGPGDICMEAGDSHAYRYVDQIDEEYDAFRWRNSIGSETKEDLLRYISEKITFRQQMYVVVVSVNTTGRSLAVTARQVTLYTVIRDSYTGVWRILSRVDIGR